MCGREIMTYYNIYQANGDNIARAAEVIKNGGLVAMPTETVYGLGANVYDAKAVAKIFAVKKRPNFDPLISHIAALDGLPDYVETDNRIMALAQAFWPGPFTMVLKRKKFCPGVDLACSGLPTATVRMPNHPVALQLIEQSGVPIVAPSANLFKSISPTTAWHVYEGLGENVDMILDGGACRVGVESTILDVTGPKAVLLRAGGTSLEDLEEFLGEKIAVSDGHAELPTAPGQLLRHYAPGHKLRINAEVPQDGEFYIGFGAYEGELNLSPGGDLCEAAANLFAFLREADALAGARTLAIAPIPEKGIGLAINDRIRRAAHD